MNFFNRLTLKNKIFISCLGFTILVSILIALFTRALLISGLTNELQIRGVGIAQSIADSSRVFILTENRAELTALAYEARHGNRKDIVKYLVISDNKGEILAHTFTTGFFKKIRDVVRQHTMEKENITSIEVARHSIFHVVVPVKEGIYTVGSVHVGLDQQHIEKLIANLRLVFLSFLSMVSIVFFFLSHRLALLITKPVSSLITYTDQLTKSDFNISPDNGLIKLQYDISAKDDEISKLTDSFIKMTSRLKHSTSRLKESQRKYQSLFESGPNPIFVVDKKTFDILDANPNATEMFGYTREKLISMTLFELCELTNTKLDYEERKGETMVISSKVKFFKKDNSFCFVNLHASPSVYRGEDVMIVAATDITELVEKDSQLIQASKMTNIEKMSVGIAHEINQPLNAIKMGSEYLCMMRERNLPVSDEEQNMVLDQISNQVTRASEIVGRLKTFSRKADFSREVIDINTCVHSINKIIGRQIALQNIELILTLDNNLTPVLAHNNRMEQVLFNMVTNAKDAINQRIEIKQDHIAGRIEITTFQKTDNVGISVQDNGIGIPENKLDSIFESFFTTKAMGEGLGLGLPIIKGIVKDYNGTIDVESKPGIGSNFTILFPAYTKK